MGEVITINDQNMHEHMAHARGLVPRTEPIGSYTAIKPFPDNLIIPRDEWTDRLNIQKRDKARLLDVRNHGNNGKPIPSTDQGQKGYCWAHSSTSVALLLRALAGLPYLELNAYAIACMIKHFRDEGGNCCDSFQFIADKGVPTYAFWAFQSMDKKNDNPKTWENAALHKFVGDFYHLERGNLDQQVSCYLRNMPMAGDCDAWGHSIAYVALEEIDPKRPEDLTDWIWNSWGDGWSELGMGKMHGSKAKPQDCIAGCIPEASLT